MRKLATIRRVNNIQPIPNADNIEVVSVDGWNVVCKKGDHHVGELVLYLEVDSWVPHEMAPFLSRGKEPREFNGVKGERLRTIKLKGQLSQGLILPIPWFDTNDRYEGEDVTEKLGIQLWEKPLPAQLKGEAKGYFPEFIQKTDQERIQNITLTDSTWEITEKLDGSSMTVYLKDGVFGVCSRNIDLKETEDNAFWKTARQYNLEEKMRGFNDNFALQGELVGPGIQGNPYQLNELRFYVFDLYDIQFQVYLKPNLVVAVCHAMDIPHVPIYGFNVPTPPSREEALRIADGTSELNPKVAREGLVFKDMTTEQSFKVISNAWLLKEKE